MVSGVVLGHAEVVLLSEKVAAEATFAASNGQGAELAVPPGVRERRDAVPIAASGLAGSGDKIRHLSVETLAVVINVLGSCGALGAMRSVAGRRPQHPSICRVLNRAA